MYVTKIQIAVSLKMQQPAIFSVCFYVSGTHSEQVKCPSTNTFFWRALKVWHFFIMDIIKTEP